MTKENLGPEAAAGVGVTDLAGSSLSSKDDLADGVKLLKHIVNGGLMRSQFPRACAEALLAALHHETPAEPLKKCPYCERPADEEGGINHLGGCIGLEKVVLNRLQYNSLVSRAFAVKTSENCEHGIPRKFCTALHDDTRG